MSSAAVVIGALRVNVLHIYFQNTVLIKQHMDEWKKMSLLI